MELDTLSVLRVSPGITTTLAASADGRERFVVRRLELSRAWPWSRQWLEGEVEVIRRARLPNVVPTTIAYRGADSIVLVRPFVAGLDIREWSARQPHPPIEDLLRAMCTLFYALGRLHRLGIAHGGVTPTNIVLAEGGELVLLDAGVTRAQLAAPIDVTDPPGPDVHAAEQTRQQRTAGFAADLSAAGIVLLESMALFNHTASVLRRLDPFGDGPHGPAQLLDLVGVEARLQPVFAKLLDPVPAMRYQSAEEVLSELEALLATSDDAGPAIGSPHGSDRSMAAAAEPPMVGRAAELAALVACADRAASGSGSVVCVSGDSGLGKSRLLDAAADHAAARGTTVLRAGAFDQAAARPLGPFGSMFQDLVAHLGAHPDAVARVRERLGGLLPVVLDQVPELAAAFADQPSKREPDGASADDLSPVAPAAIVRLLLDAFTPEQPGLIVLDDCQWADDLTWQVLAKLAESISAAGPRGAASISLIFCCRTEAVRRTRAWGVLGVEYVGLKALSDADTEQLVRSTISNVPDELVPYVTRLSHGNPLETLLMCQELMDSVLTRTPGGWVMDERHLASSAQVSQAPNQAGSSQDVGGSDLFVATRLRSLSSDTEQALRQAAVLGRRFSSELLATSLSATAPEVGRLLDDAIHRGIVRSGVGGDRQEFEFAHDRIREAVLRGLADGDRQALHLRAATALEGSTTARADYDIAYHFARAGHPSAAVPFALRAGEAGLRRQALDVAESNLAIAEAGLASRAPGAPDNDDSWFRVYEGLGTVYMLRGNYDLAAKNLISAHELTGTHTVTDSARVATLLGELAFKTGGLDEAARWMHRSLDHLALPVPVNSWHAGVLAMREATLIALGWFIGPLRAVRSVWAKEDAERLRQAARIHNRLVYEWWFTKSPVWVLWAILRSARFANALGSPRERAQALSTAAVISGTAPILAPIAMRLADRSLRLREQAGDGWGIAQSHHFRGFVLHAANRYAEAIAAFDTAIAAFDIVGDRWEQHAAMWQKALCLGRLGQLHDAGTLARDTYWQAKRRGDRIAAGTALAIWVRYLPGDVGIETLMREIGETAVGDRHTLALLHSARAARLFHAEQYAQALDAALLADELLRASRIRNHFLAPILTSHLQILRLSLPAGASGWTQDRRHQAKLSVRILRRSRRSALIFSGERPAVCREWAMMAFAAGHRRFGEVILWAAARSARRTSAQGELAACALVATLAGVTPRRGLLAAPSVIQTCRDQGVCVDRGIVESVPTHDAAAVGSSSPRHQALLDAVSSLLASDEVDEVLEKLRDAVFATTTARRVVIARSAAELAPGKQRAAAEAAEMRVTDRLVMPVLRAREGDVSVVAAFPLGEGERHAPTLEVLAAVASGVMERDVLRRESMERMVAVQEAERARIARDLHDEFSHLFAGAMGGLTTLQASSDLAVRQTASEVSEIVRQGIRVARSVAWSLRPSGLDDLGLVGCIEQYVEDFRNTFSIRVELTATGRAPTLSPAVATAVFRIVQEALTNIARHSGASDASVMLVSSANSVRAVVEDNGTGFDVEFARERKSLGLIGARERAKLVGGRLSVESSAGNGTTIMAEVPVTP